MKLGGERWPLLTSQLIGQPCKLAVHVTTCARENCPLAEQVVVLMSGSAQYKNCQVLQGGFSVQNCGMEELPTALGAASRLRQLRISDWRGGIYFEMHDLDTLSCMCSLTFLDLTQARLHRDKLVLVFSVRCRVAQRSMALHRSEYANTQPIGPRTRQDPKAPVLNKPMWPTDSLRNLCYILGSFR